MAACTPHTNTADLVRAAVEAAFPCTEFNVTSKFWGDGTSVAVRWTDGPTTEQVEVVTCQYEQVTLGSADYIFAIRHSTNGAL